MSNEPQTNAARTRELNDTIRYTMWSVFRLRDVLGEARVAERLADGKWKVHQWLKKAVLLSFRLNDMDVIPGGPGQATWWDKVPSKFDGWGPNRFRDAGFRAVPGAVVRRSAFIARNVVLMPSFVNLGAYVDESTMVDTWVTIGSCAQVGDNCHISGGAGIAGVLEPLQANPVIIEDNCFIGARAEVAEGVIVGEGSVLSMGVYIGASTRIVDRTTGDTTQLNEPGPHINTDEWAAFLRTYADLLPGADAVALCGSLPPGIHVGAYAELIRRIEATK